MMRKLIYILFLLSSLTVLNTQAQHNMIFRFKAEAIGGKEIINDEGNVAGGEVAMELPLYGNKNWHYTYNFPSPGFALGYVNLLETDSLHRMVFTYPYFLWPFVHTPQLAINLRIGAGFGGWADHQFHSTSDSHTYYFPGFFVFAGGLTFDINLAKRYGNPLHQWMVTFGINELLFHDCYVDRRTQILSVPNVTLGLKYTPNVYALPMKHPARPVHKVTALEVGALGGVSQLDRDDKDHYYPNFDINGGLYYPFSNAYRMGGGLEVFYNDIYTDYDRTLNMRYNFIDENKFYKHLRAGIFWANDITIDKFSAGVHIGFYVFNPVRVPSEYEGIEYPNYLEDWLYWKFVTKYHITKHFYCTAQVKCHLDRVEYIQTGLGWAMPDFGDRVKNPFSRISFKKEDENELRIEGPTNTKKPFRHNEQFDQ